MELVVEGLRCVRGGREVFAGMGFRLRSGEALAVTGPNGAGKSSLLRVLAGLVRPAAGTLALKGGDPELTLAEQAHYVGHLDPVKPSLTVLENLSFWSRFQGGRPGQTPAAALAAVGLETLADLPAGYLSAGQRRRLSLARLVAASRPLWLLDEPTAALDSAGQARFAALMRDHLAGGGLIVAATHAPLGIEPTGEIRLGGERGA
ncbi:MAG TPA: heme ABC exporter ATP-binding protein CcmA [Xanthobacteraceae bacterium]|nr:heme ABC exporter ATP-binding protein CcmA [Xanthobacteraceae bacterium]